MNDEQQQLIDEATLRISEQRDRIEQIMGRLHDVRTASGSLTEEEIQATLVLKHQSAQLDELRRSVSALELIDIEVKDMLDPQLLEKTRLNEFINRRSLNMDQLKARILHIEGRLEDLKKEAETSEVVVYLDITSLIN